MRVGEVSTNNRYKSVRFGSTLQKGAITAIKEFRSDCEKLGLVQFRNLIAQDGQNWDLALVHQLKVPKTDLLTPNAVLTPSEALKLIGKKDLDESYSLTVFDRYDKPLTVEEQEIGDAQTPFDCFVMLYNKAAKTLGVDEIPQHVADMFRNPHTK